MTRLFLFAPEVRDAIERLDGIRLPQRTLAHWLSIGLVTASLRWVDRAPRKGFAARGAAAPCRFTVDDFAMVRFVAQLRYLLRLSVPEVRNIVAGHKRELERVMRGRADVALVLDPRSRSVTFRRRDGDGPDLDVRAGQFVLDLRPLTEGNEAAARAARERIA